MAILNIQKAQREGARILIMLAGVSGGGKTKTALELAYGMAGGDGNKIGFLDTENGRGQLYADDYKSTYLYGEMRPPFSPARYVQAIEEFSKTGIEVLIIDSGSHEWEGLGGCQDIAEAGNPRMPNWQRAKSEHKKFMSALLASPMHIILCLRAREKAKPEEQVIDGKKKTVYVDLGLQPVTEKNVVFEATASVMIHDQGLRPEPLKVPAALQSILGRANGYLTQKDGAAIRAWIDGAKQLDPKVEHQRGLLKMAAENGMAALQEAWKATPAPMRKAISASGACPDDLKESAQAFDRQRQEAAQGADDPGLAALNDAAAQQAQQPVTAQASPQNAQQAPVSAPEPQPAPAAANDNKPAAAPAQAAAGNDDDVF